MPPKEKRARQKEHRDAIRRSRERELRKRRLVRTVAALLGVLLIALLVVSTIAGGGADRETETGSRPEPTQPIADAACGASPPEAADPRQYDEPQQVLERGVDYRAVIHTSCGDLTVDLDPKAAPDTVNSFVFLAQKGFYDGLTFHRIVGDFVIQGGDPNGDGTGGPGYELPDELPARSNVYVFGALAMANSGPDTSGSQFFFVTHDAPELDSDGNVVAGQDAPEPAGLQPLFSLFGTATEDSYEVLKTIQRVPVEGETPVAPVYINSIDIEER